MSLALTPREANIYDLCIEGLTNKEIARKLDLKETAIKGRMTQVLGKYGCANRQQLIVAHYKAMLKELGYP